MNKFPVIRFSNFENKWDDIILSKLFKFIRGRGYAKKDLSQHGEFEILLYGMLYTNYKSKLVSTNSFTNLLDNSVMSKGNEIVIPSSGETSEDIARATAICSSDIILASDMNILTPIDDSISSHFIAMLLTYGKANQKLIKKAQGNSVVHIYNSDLKNIEIMIPTFEEQTQIGDFFKELDELIELQLFSITNLEEVKKAFLKKLFPHKNLLYPTVRFRDFTRNWKHVKLKKIGEIHSAGVDKKINEFDNPVTLLNYIDIYNKKPIDEKKFKKMMKVTATKQQLIEKNVMIGDIFFTPSSETREDIGHSLTITNEYSNFVYSYHIIRFRPRKNTLDINFSNYFANVEDVRKEMIKNCQGSQRFTLSLGDFRNLNVSLPHIKEQEKIGTVLKDLDDLIELENKELKLLQEMKKGFLQKMFV